LASRTVRGHVAVKEQHTCQRSPSLISAFRAPSSAHSPRTASHIRSRSGRDRRGRDTAERDMSLRLRRDDAWGWQRRSSGSRATSRWPITPPTVVARGSAAPSLRLTQFRCSGLGHASSRVRPAGPIPTEEPPLALTRSRRSSRTLRRPRPGWSPSHPSLISIRRPLTPSAWASWRWAAVCSARVRSARWLRTRGSRTAGIPGS